MLKEVKEESAKSKVHLCFMQVQLKTCFQPTKDLFPNNKKRLVSEVKKQCEDVNIMNIMNISRYKI